MTNHLYWEISEWNKMVHAILTSPYELELDLLTSVLYDINLD